GRAGGPSYTALVGVNEKRENSREETREKRETAVTSAPVGRLRARRGWGPPQIGRVPPPPPPARGAAASGPSQLPLSPIGRGSDGADPRDDEEAGAHGSSRWAQSSTSETVGCPETRDSPDSP